MKKIIRILSIVCFVLVILTLCLFTTIDKTPYHQTLYYKETIKKINSFKIDSFKSRSRYFKAGWAKESIVPNFHIPISGYGVRNDFECVHDTLYARAIVFDNGSEKVAIVSLDLLIIPPVVFEKFRQSGLIAGVKKENVYFSATHTHSSVGGWSDELAGRFISGKYSEKMVDKLINSISGSIRKATSFMEESTIGYDQYDASSMVMNRLVQEKGTTDPWLRVVKIQKKSGPIATFTTFAAHATCLSSKDSCLSGDYPSFLVDSLEKSNKIEFAIYCAGAVGSMGPGDMGKANYGQATSIADSLSKKILQGLDKIELKTPDTLSTFFIPVALREPHLKISEDFRFRPWVFKTLMGDQTIGIKALRLGNIVLIGTPCDFSGELVDEFSSISKKKNIHTIITSFNGGYIGYITEDKHYNLQKSETMEMNWFGPYNGAYFTEIINKILEKI